MEIVNPRIFESFRFSHDRAAGTGCTGEVELCIEAVALHPRTRSRCGSSARSVTDATVSPEPLAGVEMSATVVRVGEGVAKPRSGDNIVALAAGGCFKSYATVPAGPIVLAAATARTTASRNWQGC